MLLEETPVLQGRVAEGAPSRALRANALTVLGCVFAAAVAAYMLVAYHLPLGGGVVMAAAVLLLFIFALVLRGLQHHGHQRFGLANTVTAVRAALVSIIAAAVFCPGAAQSIANVPWIFVALVLVALVLDGVDGFVARREAQVSALGARFDMEVDALLILCLSTAAYLLGKAGAWVLLIGLMRYAFLLLHYPVPRLSGALPPSLRRKFVCVVQVAVLCLILVPDIVQPVSSWLAAIALLLLCHSFAVDCLYLLTKAEVRE